MADLNKSSFTADRMPSSTAGNVVVHGVGSVIRVPKWRPLADGENVRPYHSTEGGSSLYDF